MAWPADIRSRQFIPSFGIMGVLREGLLVMMKLDIHRTDFSLEFRIEQAWANSVGATIIASSTLNDCEFRIYSSRERLMRGETQ